MRGHSWRRSREARFTNASVGAACFVLLPCGHGVAFVALMVCVYSFPGACLDLGRIMVVLAMGTLITYSYHSVYFDLDKPVLPQGHHALRYKVWTGMAWVRWGEGGAGGGGRGEGSAG